MDKVIRITSQQGFGEAWTNAAPPVTLNLCDFTIPRGLNIDLSKSYIAFNAQITSDNAQPCNSTMYLETSGTGNGNFNVPVSAVIRNASISNGRGAVESIRRVDTLNCAMFGLLDDMESRQNNLNTFAQYEGGRGVGNQTSFFLDAVTDNHNPEGNILNAQHTSREVARDLKVPLAELFGVANSTAYSTDVFGETRIHLETNFKNVKAKVLGGAEATSDGFDETTKYGAMRPLTLVDGTVIGDNLNPLETALSYGDWQYVMPFFVGQAVVANATASAGTAFGTDVDCIITGLQFQEDNTSTPPSSVAGRVNITITRADGTPFYTLDADATVDGITLKAKVDQTLTPTINRAELVIQISGEAPEQQITYDTWTTEEDVGNGNANFNKAYSLEAETTLWMACFCPAGKILPDTPITSYRFAIDNEEETGNRSIVMANAAAIQGSSLQYDRLIRALDNQGGLGFRNAQLKYYSNDAGSTQATAYSNPVSVIAETAPATPMNKVLNLNIENAGALADIKIYKSVQRTI